MAEIGRILTQEKVLTPTEYKNTVQKLSYVNVNAKFNVWRTETIKRILTNPTYIGNMAQHRSEKISYKIKKFRKIPRSGWIIAENTHEPIISKEDFETVQELIKKKACISYPTERVPHLLAGLIFCGDCKMPMTFRRLGAQKELFCICSGYSRFGKDKCQRNIIKEDLLNEYVITNLKEISKKVIKNQEEFCNGFKFAKINSPSDKNDKEKKAILKRLDEIRTIIKSLYEDKVKGIVSENDFIAMSSEFNIERDELSNQLLRIEEKQQIENKTKSPEQVIEIIKNIVDFNNISPLLIGQLIENVEIYKSKEIIINYKFKNPFE